MPHIIRFAKPVQIADSEQYINDCCIGGDVVLDQLLPALREHYGSDLQAIQEDWGWFVWFEQSGVKLAVDVHTDDYALGTYQVHLTSSRPRRWLGAKIQDTPDLERLRVLVLTQLQSWPVERLQSEHVDDKYRPIESAT